MTAFDKLCKTFTEIGVGFEIEDVGEASVSVERVDMPRGALAVATGAATYYFGGDDYHYIGAVDSEGEFCARKRV